MPETYTRENFTSAAIPKGLPRDTQKTVRNAVALGWKLMVTNRGHATLIAPEPNEHQTINISTSKRNKVEGPTRQIREKIKRYGDASLLEDVVENPPEDDDMEAALERAERARERYEREQQEQQEQQAEDDSIESDEIILVSEAPRKFMESGRERTSEAVIERHWSDGSVDYRCAVEGCDFATTNHRSFSGHGKRHGRAAQTSHQSAPSTLEHVLSARIGAGLAWNDVDAAAQTLAHSVQAWLDGQTRPEEAPAASSGDSEAEQTLDRIRELLDDGSRAADRDRIAALEAEKDALEAKATEALEEAQRLREELSALAGLLSKYGTAS